MAIETNLLPFPQLKERGAGVARYLSRHKLCQQWAEEFKAKGRWRRSYSFRNTYSVRAYLRGIPGESVAMAMGHSELTQSTHYVTGTMEATSEVFERIFGRKQMLPTEGELAVNYIWNLPTLYKFQLKK